MAAVGRNHAFAALQTGLSDQQAARALRLLAQTAVWADAAAPLFGQFAVGVLPWLPLQPAAPASTNAPGWPFRKLPGAEKISAPMKSEHGGEKHEAAAEPKEIKAESFFTVGY